MEMLVSQLLKFVSHTMFITLTQHFSLLTNKVNRSGYQTLSDTRECDIAY